jgi:hypothetical protein
MALPPPSHASWRECWLSDRGRYWHARASTPPVHPAAVRARLSAHTWSRAGSRAGQHRASRFQTPAATGRPDHPERPTPRYSLLSTRHMAPSAVIRDMPTWTRRRLKQAWSTPVPSWSSARSLRASTVPTHTPSSCWHGSTSLESRPAPHPRFVVPGPTLRQQFLQDLLDEGSFAVVQVGPRAIQMLRAVAVSAWGTHVLNCLACIPPAHPASHWNRRSIGSSERSATTPARRPVCAAPGRAVPSC